MDRMIVKIETNKGVIYEVGKAPTEGDFAVQSIEFRRDGLRSINGGISDPAHYLVTSVHPMSDKDIVFTVIPYDRVDSIMFVIVEKETSGKKDDFETPTEMKHE